MVGLFPQTSSGKHLDARSVRPRGGPSLLLDTCCVFDTLPGATSRLYVIVEEGLQILNVPGSPLSPNFSHGAQNHSTIGLLCLDPPHRLSEVWLNIIRALPLGLSYSNPHVGPRALHYQESMLFNA